MSKRERLVFFGDVKGTKSALEGFEQSGAKVLSKRIEHLQSSFSTCFAKYSDQSRSLSAVTFSDSVLAHWSDVVEGCRFATFFVRDLWELLDKNIVHFRGFLDYGPEIDETSVLGYVFDSVHERFVRILPTGIAMWSVTVAEASHFPDGIFVSTRLIDRLPYQQYSENVFQAGPFTYNQMLFNPRVI